MKRWRTLAMAAALAGGVCASARAEVWAYVDAQGQPHFASQQLDARYELFFRGDGGAPAAPTPRAVSVPTAAAKLLAWFDISPGYRQVQHLVREGARNSGLDPELLKALIATESGFDAQAVSPKGAVGLMQVMPATAQQWGLRASATQAVDARLRDPAQNIRIGTRHLRHLVDQFAGRLDLALAAYNAGEGAVLRARRQVPQIRETQDYVKTVMQLYTMLKPPAAVVSAQQARLPAGRGRAMPGAVAFAMPGAPAVRPYGDADSAEAALQFGAGEPAL